MDYLLRPEIQDFIHKNLNVSAGDLMLRRDKYPTYPMKAIAEQILCLQKARTKIPAWFATKNILYHSLALEQCSSEITARFKSQILWGKTLADLCGGFGVDTCFFAHKFEKVIHIEPNLDLQNLVRHNFRQLGIENVSFNNEKAEDFIKRNIPTDCIYLDPSRRNELQKKVFLLRDCEPNILKLKNDLFALSKQVLLKTSPMLDIEQGVRDLASVEKVYVIAVENEVRELLFALKKEITKEPEIIAVNLLKNQNKEFFSFYKSDEREAKVQYSKALRYMYEPNLAILKAGAFKFFAAKFNLFKLHPNSHLYTSESYKPDIPARIFELQNQCKYDKKEISKISQNKKANITACNFLDSVAQIRRKLQVKEGGEDYIFATIGLDNKPVLLITKKVKNKSE